MASEAVQHADAAGLAVSPDTFQEGDIAGTCAVVVALQRRDAVRIRADDGDRFDFCWIQGQGSVVFQKNHALFCRLQGQRIVFIGIGIGDGDTVVFAVFIEEAQEIPGCEKTFTGCRDLFFRHQSLFQSLEHMEIGVAAVQVAAVFQGQGGAFFGRVGHFMILMEIADGPAVADHMTAEPPLFAQGFLQQRFASAGGLAVDAVVGTHDGLHFRFLYCFFKGGEVGFSHVFWICHGVELMSQGLGSAVDGKMLAAGGDLQVFSVSLEAFDEADAQTGGQIGILAVGFVTAAPPRIAENVDIRAPNRQPLIDIPVAVGALAVIFRTGLPGNCGGDFFLEILVEDGGQADGLGENGGRSGAGNPVEHFIPPVVGGNTEPRDGRRVVFQLGSFFLNRHFCDQFSGLCGSFFSVSHHFRSPVPHHFMPGNTSFTLYIIITRISRTYNLKMFVFFGIFREIKSGT